VAVNPERIKEARLRANMSRADLAYAIRDATGGRIKATERSVRRWERREHAPADGVVPAIAQATGEDISYFYGDDDTEEDDVSDPVAALTDAIKALVRAERREHIDELVRTIKGEL
jgi:transcriptional regulator with XRE-family HTH domain